jgi:hypothetical protein
MKGGQGLPLNLIVLAAIAVLVLVLVIMFVSGSLGNLFGGLRTIEEGATPEAVTGFRIGCEQNCFQIQQLADTERQFTGSAYCTDTIRVNTTTGLQNIHCWQDPVIVDCSKTVQGLNCRGEGDICTCT